MKVVPSSVDERTSTLPPWAVTISRAMKSPSPMLVGGAVPARSVGPCTRGSKIRPKVIRRNDAAVAHLHDEIVSLALRDHDDGRAPGAMLRRVVQQVGHRLVHAGGIEAPVEVARRFETEFGLRVHERDFPDHRLAHGFEVAFGRLDGDALAEA